MSGSRPPYTRGPGRPSGDRASLDQLNRTIDGLEARLEGLIGTPRGGRAAPSREEVRDPVDEIRERQRALGALRDRTSIRDTIAARAERLREQDERQPARHQPAAYQAQPAYPPQTQPRADFAGRAEPRDRVAPVPQPAVRDTSAADIARALVDLRQDLKRDLTEGLTREMDALRAEMRAIRSAAEGSDSVEDIRGEMQRLAESIGQLGRQASPAQADALRKEFNDMRSLIDGLAREDSVRRMETRWSGVEQRLNAFDASRDDELVALAYRLDEIKSQIESVGNPKVLHALEDKLVTVAHAIETIGRQIQPDDHHMASRFAELDVRLDEISRAIISSGRTAGNADHAGVTRLENRLTDLARHVESLASRRDDGLAMRLEALAARVEEIAADDTASRLDERLHQLSVMMERSSRGGDAELDRHLHDISVKIDALERGNLNEHLLDRLDVIARRIDGLNAPQAVDTRHADMRFERLEDQLATIATHLAETQAAPRDDREALRGLEAQIANLSSLIATNAATAPAGGALPAEFETRMHALEDYLATSDEYIIEAARQAAEAVMEAYGRNGVGTAQQVNAGDISAIAALAEDLRALEGLSRSSEERTARTFEVLHETLVHIAEKLERLEEGMERRSQEPVAAPLSAPMAMSAATPAVGSLKQAAEAQRAESQRGSSITRLAPVVEDDETDPFGEAIAAALGGREPRAADGASASLVAAREDMLRSQVKHPAPEVVEAVFASAAAGRRDAPAAVSDMAAAPVRAGHDDEIMPAVIDDAAEDEAGAPARGGLLSSLTRRFAPQRKDKKVAAPAPARHEVAPSPSIDAADAIAPDMSSELLEPGSGLPDVKRILERVRAGQRDGARAADAVEGEKGDYYIAAARRAAKLAAEEAGTIRTEQGESRADAGTKRFNRRPILLAVGAVLLAVMAFPLVNTLVNGETAPPAIQASTDNRTAETSAAPADEPQSNVRAEAEAVVAATPSAVTPTDEKAAEQQAADTATVPADEATAALPADSAEPQAQGTVVPATTVPTTTLTRPADSAAEPSQAAGEQPPVETPAAAPATVSEAAPVTVPDTIGPAPLVEAARKGDPLAYFEIGARYTDGRGVTADLAEAAKWYQRAADAGVVPAEYRLANLYEKGTGVARDLDKAKALYEAAANRGNASAMHNLAVLLATGSGGNPDFKAAGEWFRKAADHGVKDSQFNLAILYARGNGVPQDLEESYKWFAVAASEGDTDAAQKRDEVATAMKPEQLAGAKAKVEAWKVQPLNADANSANIPDSWTGGGVKTSTIDMKKAIRNIQAILNNNGFKAGTPDGALGPQTVNAIKEFQKSIGQAPTGELTDALVRELLKRNQAKAG
ncbi:peptidoglycan-binding protein [Rhizobium sp. SG2393]|uniref:peptidoglycan-binding protein n=1 Tax=Rhizobium sp. SG2393 TaxID=3276279 RepID=UPI00366A9E44